MRFIHFVCFNLILNFPRYIESVTALIQFVFHMRHPPIAILLFELLAPALMPLRHDLVNDCRNLLGDERGREVAHLGV